MAAFAQLRRRVGRGAAALALIASVAPAPAAADPDGAAQIRVAGRDSLQIVGAQGQALSTWQVGCEVYDLLRIGDMVYVACGPQGVRSFDISAPGQPRQTAHFGTGRNVVKLAQSGNNLLAIVAEYGVVAYALNDPHQPVLTRLDVPAAGAAAPLALMPSPPVAPVSPAVPAAPAVPVAPALLRAPVPVRPARVGPARVVSVRGGWVAVTSDTPVHRGYHFIVHSQRLIRVTDPSTGLAEQRPANEPMGMFVIELVSPTGGSGRLPRGTVARVGDLAEPTEEPLRVPKVVPVEPREEKWHVSVAVFLENCMRLSSMRSIPRHLSQ